MSNLLWVGLGGFLGAVGRYLMASWVIERSKSALPLGTLSVNLVGCLLIGVLMTLAEERQVLGDQARLFLFTGVIGSFTTFSTLALEGQDLFADGEGPLALFYLGLSVVLGLALVWVGRAGMSALL